MIRKEYIEEIRKHVLSAKIVKVYNADLNIQDTNSSSLAFPSFEQILEYANKASNSDKFFERVSFTLTNYKKYLDSNTERKYSVSISPLKKRVQLSENIINKILFVMGQAVHFPEFPEFNISKNISLSYNETYVDHINFLFNLLESLVSKAKKYVLQNGVYSTSYKIDYKQRISDLKGNDPHTILININESIKKIVDKKYVPDFLSDGSDDIKEMMRVFWRGLFHLLYFSKPIENASFDIDGMVKVNNIKEWLQSQLIHHFEPINEILSDKTFASLTDLQIKEIFDKAIKIKVPKEINPRSEKDMLSNKCMAEQKLEGLIGLDEVKEVVEKIKAYAIASKNSGDLNLHMAFYGNPGTGKTEVARLIGEILYENGILLTNKYVEASRSDLIGEYVGHTAPKTKAIIEKAMGGVLFIDEAYSLIPEGDSKDFGHEAVAELIQSMETHRGKFCVILAGYKNQLKKMMATNPGFNSRIQFHVDFKNYSRDEIREIILLLIDKDGYIINDDALDKMLDAIDSMRTNPDFANARIARNVVQQCIMCLNLRAGDPNDKNITIADVNKYIHDSNIIVGSSPSNDKIMSGDEQLANLIGLTNVKTSIKKIRAFAKKNSGANINLHMAFAGNPGTGKTEVANIISRVLYEAGVLTEAKLIMANRESLVGQYVGQTAKKTKEIIDKAMGGVLFIDEAYSLTNEGGGDFGNEAIAILIDEMEKNKGKFCVIIAGYNDPLKQMINSNPGFASRVQFWINFQDYTRDEIRQIILKFLNNGNIKYSISDEAMELLLNIIDHYRNQPDFANARTARKILQDIILNQNLRVEDEPENNSIVIDDVMQYIDENCLSV